MKQTNVISRNRCRRSLAPHLINALKSATVKSQYAPGDTSANNSGIVEAFAFLPMIPPTDSRPLLRGLHCSIEHHRGESSPMRAIGSGARLSTQILGAGYRSAPNNQETRHYAKFFSTSPRRGTFETATSLRWEVTLAESCGQDTNETQKHLILQANLDDRQTETLNSSRFPKVGYAPRNDSKQPKRGGRVDERSEIHKRLRWISLRSSTLRTFTLFLNR